MNLPRMVRQHVLHLRARVQAASLTPDEAGAKLAAHLKANWPSLADDLLLRWCIARFRRSNPLPEGWVQQDLWPAHLWDQPLSKAMAYAEEQEEITARFHSRGTRRMTEMCELMLAADGNMQMTLEAAYRLAHPEEWIAS